MFFWFFFLLAPICFDTVSPLAATWHDHRAATWSPWNLHKRRYILQHQFPPQPSPPPLLMQPAPSPRAFNPTMLTTINNNQFNIITRTTPTPPTRPVWAATRSSDDAKNCTFPLQKSQKVRMPKSLSLANVDSCYFKNLKHAKADTISLTESTVSTPPSTS